MNKKNIDFDEKSYSIWAGMNKIYDSEFFRFSYSSFLTPTSVFDYHFKTEKLELKKRNKVKGGFDKNKYETDVIFAQSTDGESIPISIVYKKGIKMDGRNNLVLEGYGAYGSSNDPYFSISRLSLLQRGVIYAKAHIRGGGEKGKAWYENGKLLKKKNSFNDFIACMEKLIETGYTSAENLVITGGSAGGLLMGVVVNLRPDMIKGAVISVPFFDVINSMLDENIPLTVMEFDEWGNPKEKEYFDYMFSYSPYDNIEQKKYPDILITAGFNDARVAYWEPLKWMAKMRYFRNCLENKECYMKKNRLLLKMNLFGHGGSSGRYEYFKEAAFEYAFIFDILGIKL